MRSSSQTSDVIVIGAGVAVVVVAVLVTFALGRRRGRRLATIVEIRRV